MYNTPYMIGFSHYFYHSDYVDTIAAKAGYECIGIETVNGYDCRIVQYPTQYPEKGYTKNWYYETDDFTVCTKEVTYDANGDIYDQSYYLWNFGTVTDADVTSPNGKYIIYEADGSVTEP
jgi:hypothetical protein